MLNNDKNRAAGKGGLMKEGCLPEEKYVLVSIVRKEVANQLVQVCRCHHALASTIALGQGTARSEILEYLGLEVDEKEIVISYVQADQAQAVLQSLRKELEMDLPGHGIAFLVPILQDKGLKAVFRLAEQLNQAVVKTAPKADPYTVEDEGIIFGEHDLIMAMLPAGLSGEAMERARAAGAVGGTVVSGQSCTMQQAGEFLDFSIDPDKELLLMLVRKRYTGGILKALYECMCLEGKADGIAFALPVSAAVGLTHRLTVLPDGTVTEMSHRC